MTTNQSSREAKVGGGSTRYGSAESPRSVGIEIDERLYQRSQAKAEQSGKTLREVIEAYLHSWVGPEPEVPPVTRIREEQYVVRAGDTLAKIALRMYGDAKKYVVIAQYNNITDAGLIRVGQQLRIPFTETVTEGAPLTGRPFRFPLDETETSYYKFGSIYAPSSHWAGKPHPGVDFHQHKGANVYAIGEGTVLVNKYDARGYGHYIMIEHTVTSGEKVYSLYGHLQEDAALQETGVASPAVGTKVIGQNVVIGKEGETGYAGVPHVHFELKRTSDLGLYSMINTHNLRDYFYDPYTFIRDANNRYVPA